MPTDATRQVLTILVVLAVGVANAGLGTDARDVTATDDVWDGIDTLDSTVSGLFTTVGAGGADGRMSEPDGEIARRDGLDDHRGGLDDTRQPTRPRLAPSAIGSPTASAMSARETTPREGQETRSEPPDAGDTKANATEVEAGVTVSGMTSTDDDPDDWYRIDVPAGAVVEFTRGVYFGELNGQEYDLQQTEQILSESGGTLFFKAGFIGPCLAPDRDPCTTNYTFTVTIRSVSEPNDDLGNATDITRNVTITDNLSVNQASLDEVDTFAFATDAGDRTTITFQRATRGGVTVVHLVAPDGRTVATRYVATAAPATITLDANQDGTYRVQVVVVSNQPPEGNQGGVIDYTLSLQTEPGAATAREYSRNTFAFAKYDLPFAELSTETKGEIREIVRRQPLAEGVTPAEVQTRDEIAQARFGEPYDALSNDQQSEVDQAYLAQFAD